VLLNAKAAATKGVPMSRPTEGACYSKTTPMQGGADLARKLSTRGSLLGETTSTAIFLALRGQPFPSPRANDPRHVPARHKRRRERAGATLVDN